MSGLIQGLSSSPFIAGRAFLAAFLLALAARFQWGDFERPPEWFFCDAALWVLGALALAEITADKIPEFRELLLAVDNYVKPTVAFGITLGVFSPEVSSLLEPMVENPSVSQAGLLVGLQSSFGGGLLSVVLAGINAAGTLFLVRTRNTLLGILVESDQDDDSGLAGMTSWMTDIYVVGGIILFVFAPVVAFLLTGFALAAATWVQQEAERREQKVRVPCSACGHKNLTVALKCAKCGSALPEPKKLSFLGTATTSGAVSNLEQHRQSLLQWKRCPDCGAALPKKEFYQDCSSCGLQTFRDVNEAEKYLSRIEGKISQVLLISGALGLVPVLGLVAGVLYYRWSLIPNLRRYLTRTESLGGRWVVRGINFIILWFQPIPLLGALALPAMCLTNYKFYRSRFKAHLEKMRIEAQSGEYPPR